jgi:NADP-dependent 3-hydroxy acid dehydrogenase YdfG
MIKVILISGCSTGFERNLPQQLTQAGYTVAAAARKQDRMGLA